MAPAGEAAAAGEEVTAVEMAAMAPVTARLRRQQLQQQLQPRPTLAQANPRPAWGELEARRPRHQLARARPLQELLVLLRGQPRPLEAMTDLGPRQDSGGSRQAVLAV